jgi:hypothetical protein
MTRDDFRIGLEFYTATGRWRCTDVGTRVIAAIQLNQEDPSWYAGPPYAVVEWVFDEYDFGGCSLDPIDVLANELDVEAFEERVAQARSSLREGRGTAIEQLREKRDIKAVITYPKIKTVLPLDDCCLQVTFDNAVCKIYDCKPLLDKPVFAPLADNWLFHAVRVDQGGYGISWNDEIDLAESELWTHGEPLESDELLAEYGLDYSKSRPNHYANRIQHAHEVPVQG